MTRILGVFVVLLLSAQQPQDLKRALTDKVEQMMELVQSIPAGPTCEPTVPRSDVLGEIAAELKAIRVELADLKAAKAKQ